MHGQISQMTSTVGTTSTALMLNHTCKPYFIKCYHYKTESKIAPPCMFRCTSNVHFTVMAPLLARGPGVKFYPPSSVYFIDVKVRVVALYW